MKLGPRQAGLATLTERSPAKPMIHDQTEAWAQPLPLAVSALVGPSNRPTCPLEPRPVQGDLRPPSRQGLGDPTPFARRTPPRPPLPWETQRDGRAVRRSVRIKVHRSEGIGFGSGTLIESPTDSRILVPDQRSPDSLRQCPRSAVRPLDASLRKNPSATHPSSQ